MSVMQAGNAESGTMGSNGVVSGSFYNEDSGPDSNVSDEHSFIVLDRETVEDNERKVSELVSSMQSFQFGSAAFTNHFSLVPPVSTVLNGELPSHMSNVSSGLPSDVQQRMDSLIQDNLKLQETVDQTNLVLKQMMLTLAQWSTDMEKVRQDHKEKFQETRSLVMKLKKEKAEMRAEIDELRNQTRSLLLEPTEPTVKELELKTYIDDLTSHLNATEAAHQKEIEKNKGYIEKVTALKEKLKQSETQLAHLTSLQEEVERLKNDLEELEMLRNENKRLKNDIQSLSSVERHSQDYQSAQAKGFSLRVDELTAKLMISEEELGKARAEISQFKSQGRDLVRDEDSSNSGETRLRNAESTVQRLRLRIDEMTARIVDVDQKCESQAQEINNLQEENLRLHRQNEGIAILQAQVEVYRSDFIAERECRERLAGEKEQLAEDLRRLHRRNRELQDQQHGLENPSAAGNDESSRNVMPNQLPEEERLQRASYYRCPVCQNMTFSTLHLLNEHIDRCASDFS